MQLFLVHMPIIPHVKESLDVALMNSLLMLVQAKELELQFQHSWRALQFMKLIFVHLLS